MKAVKPRHRKPQTEAQIAQRRAVPPRKRELSEAELAQRRAASAAAMGHHTGPITEAGKAVVSRNAWKTGQYSAAHKLQRDLVGTSIAGSFGKPCKTTCPWHPDNGKRTEAPCSLVTSGQTQAGGDCLDRRVYVEAFDAIIAAVQGGEMDGMNGVLAANMAANMQLLQQLREEISAKGMTLVSPMIDKSGKIIRDDDGTMVIGKVHMNPAMMALIRLLESMGLNLPELMATPRAREKLRDDDQRNDTMSALLGAVMNRFSGAQSPRGTPRTMEHGDADA